MCVLFLKFNVSLTNRSEMLSTLCNLVWNRNIRSVLTTLRKCDDKDYILKNEIIASLSKRKNADRNSTRWTQMIASALYGCYAFYGNHRYTVNLDGDIFGVLFTICTCTCRLLFSIVNFKISLVQMFRMLVFDRIVAQFGARASACIWKYNDELM